MTTMEITINRRARLVNSDGNYPGEKGWEENDTPAGGAVVDLSGCIAKLCQELQVLASVWKMLQFAVFPVLRATAAIRSADCIA